MASNQNVVLQGQKIYLTNTFLTSLINFFILPMLYLIVMNGCCFFTTY